MRLASTAAFCAPVALALSAAGFIVPSRVSLPRRPSLRTHTRAQSHVPSTRFSRPTVGYRPRDSGRDTLFGPNRGRRAEATAVAPLNAFGGGGFGGGGLGGGGRPSRGPFGLDPGTLFTLVFVLLVVFAPGVIFGAFNVLFLVFTLGPLLLSVGVTIYNRVNSVDAPCPVCGVQLEGFKGTQNQCPSCGAMLMTKDNSFEAMGTGYVRDEVGRQQEFSRTADSGVIDVDAIDVDD